MQEKDADIVTIQETKVIEAGSQDILKISNYNHYALPAKEEPAAKRGKKKKGGKSGGLVTYVHKKHDSVLKGKLDNKGGQHITVEVFLNNGQTINVTNSYRKHVERKIKEEATDFITNAINAGSNVNHFILGDMNGESLKWGDRENAAGKAIDEKLTEEFYLTYNNGEITRLGGRTEEDTAIRYYSR